jgi:hypothetical protein
MTYKIKLSVATAFKPVEQNAVYADILDLRPTMITVEYGNYTLGSEGLILTNPVQRWHFEKGSHPEFILKLKKIFYYGKELPILEIINKLKSEYPNVDFSKMQIEVPNVVINDGKRFKE